MKNRLKVYRAMHDLTQEQLAIKLDVTRATINAIENQRYDPSLRLAFQIALFFRVQIEDVFIYKTVESLQYTKENSSDKAPGDLLPGLPPQLRI